MTLFAAFSVALTPVDAGPVMPPEWPPAMACGQYDICSSQRGLLPLGAFLRGEGAGGCFVFSLFQRVYYTNTVVMLRVRSAVQLGEHSRYRWMLVPLWVGELFQPRMRRL
jgi:hypothetical protein